jgi:hypothetical protein
MGLDREPLLKPQSGLDEWLRAEYPDRRQRVIS